MIGKGTEKLEDMFPVGLFPHLSFHGTPAFPFPNGKYISCYSFITKRMCIDLEVTGGKPVSQPFSSMGKTGSNTGLLYRIVPCVTHTHCDSHTLTGLYKLGTINLLLPVHRSIDSFCTLAS